jgi:glycosyltransferase involved in cell wall biosynthesis
MQEKIHSLGISIIIPVLNEEKRVKPCIERLLSYCKEKGWDFELIFVDDGSIDSTVSIVKSYTILEERVKILNCPRRLGKGGSIVHAVLNEPLKDCVTFMDVDLSAEPSELVRLLAYIDEYDIVVGSRVLRDGLRPVKRPWYRSFLSNSYSMLFRALFRIPIYDPQCGLKLFRRGITANLFDNVKIMGFAFDTDLIVTASAQGLRMKEVPINWTHGMFSKVSVIKEVRSMGLDIVSIWYRYHLSWLHNKESYPQKKGSFFGKILFSILSINNSVRARALTGSVGKLTIQRLN